MSSSDGAQRRAWLLAGLGAATGWILPGCGFKLRAPARLSFDSIALTGFAPRSLLADALRVRLRTQVRVLDSPDRADVVLVALGDAREKSVVATTAASQVREFALRLRFGFQVQRPDGRLLLPKAELLLARALSYREDQALAKEFEEGELYREMQSDVVTQVLNRLATLDV